MTFRPHPKYASNSAKNGPWTTCDVCGFIDSHSRMQWQYDYRGGNSPVNVRILKCPRCVDALRFQAKLVILPPDPRPIMNTRPESYVVDETNWLTTQDSEIIDTQAGDNFITSIPNPASQAVSGEDVVVAEAAVDIVTEDGLEIVTEEGDGNPLDFEPNP